MLSFCLNQVHPHYVSMLLLPDTECEVTLTKRGRLVVVLFSPQRATTFGIEKNVMKRVKAVEVHVALSFTVMLKLLCLCWCQAPFSSGKEESQQPGTGTEACLLHPCE